MERRKRQPLAAPCGTDVTRSGKRFIQESLAQHVNDCPYRKQIERPEHELTDMIAYSDAPSGAYFALAWELGED